MGQEKVRRIRRCSPELATRARQLRQEATEAEKVLWETVRRKQLGVNFRRQHLVGTFVLDFYCPERRLAIEADGGIHDDPEVAARDGLRSAEIARHGYRMVRLRNEEILGDMEAALDRIRAAL